MQIKSINAPLVMIGKGVRVTSERWTEIDPDKLSEEDRAQFDSLKERGLIGIHPNDSGEAIPMIAPGAPRNRDDADSLKARVRELEAENRRLKQELGEDLDNPDVSTPASRMAPAAKEDAPGTTPRELGRPGAAVSEGTSVPKDEGKRQRSTPDEAFTEPAPSTKTTTKKGH